ncbi:hypothetical protein MF271_23360 (plasmid) [Deinococcus sp. KNUC1210]|uniref:hypothetical protein n=1 Tax=Deinococcus sp. KNUC1210 TaxID=2917691 RepID=UPI001EF04AC2|nr:hypothetical protein [Deinococcus sp. KNUC1210]ULH17912.1 hypothetical protein MF271_23360 [Deinococcus sp. KNUC1210]
MPGEGKGETHRAAVFVTGWPTQDHQGRLHIMGVPITSLNPEHSKQRLEAVLLLASRPGGRLKPSVPLRVRPVRSHRSNGSTFEVVGQLVRCERGTGHLLLNVYHGLQGTGQAVHLRVTDDASPRPSPWSVLRS